MPKSLRNTLPIVAANAEIPYTTTADAEMLLHQAMAHLEQVMRLMAQAILLQPTLDESLGMEAQRLIGVCEAIRAEIETIERRRLRE